MEKAVWGIQIMAALTGVLITRGFFDTLLKRKERVPKWLEWVLWGGNFVCGILIAGVVLRRSGGRLTFVSEFLPIAGWAAVVLLLYGGNLKKKTFAVLLYFAGSVMTKWGSLFLLEQSGLLSVSPGIFGWAFGKMAAVFILQAVKGIQEEPAEGSRSKRYRAAGIIINVGSLLFLFNLFMLVRNGQEEMLILFSSFSVILALSVNVVFFMLYGDLLEKEELVEEQSEARKQQSVLLDVQNEETEETWNELKKFRHDYANHLICIREHLKRNNMPEALEYVNHLLGSFKGEYGTKKMSNSFLDTFLGYKIRNAKQDQIRFETDIVIPKELPFDEADLCTILGNALDNAAEAVKKLPEKDRIIAVSINYKRHTLRILVENPYDGVIKKDRKGRLLTTKPDADSHGIGIYSMEKAVKKGHGLVEISYTEEKFRLNVLLYEG